MAREFAPKLLIGVPSLLSSSDSRSESPDSTDLHKTNSEPLSSGSGEKTKWFLTAVAFDKLLERFSSNRDEAGIQYELARRKVIRFFEWRLVGTAEEYADETMNRVARRIDEGQNIDRVMAYIFGVARVILKEIIKERERAPIALDDTPDGLCQSAPEVLDPDMRQICFDQCLETLEIESRKLILDYYEGDGRAKIQKRQQLANKFQIPLNALRIRVHRIRKTLENCIADCLEHTEARNN
jgi:DNA-directed RNA polymerase specialized sigma24 family protein